MARESVGSRLTAGAQPANAQGGPALLHRPQQPAVVLVVDCGRRRVQTVDGLDRDLHLARTALLSAGAERPWRAGQIGQELEQHGVRVSAFPQHDSRMIPASQRLYDAVVEGRLLHGDDPKLNAHVAAAVARHGRRGRHRPPSISLWPWPS